MCARGPPNPEVHRTRAGTAITLGNGRRRPSPVTTTFGGRERMTEAERKAGTDPFLMLVWLRDKASDRKLRRFAIGCCRSWDGLSADGRASAALEVAEWYAEGQVGL